MLKGLGKGEDSEVAVAIDKGTDAVAMFEKQRRLKTEQLQPQYSSEEEGEESSEEPKPEEAKKEADTVQEKTALRKLEL